MKLTLGSYTINIDKTPATPTRTAAYTPPIAFRTNRPVTIDGQTLEWVATRSGPSGWVLIPFGAPDTSVRFRKYDTIDGTKLLKI